MSGFSSGQLAASGPRPPLPAPAPAAFVSALAGPRYSVYCIFTGLLVAWLFFAEGMLEESHLRYHTTPLFPMWLMGEEGCACPGVCFAGFVIIQRYLCHSYL